MVVDARDAWERKTVGKALGSTNASRGMLEFHADLNSPALLDAFDAEKYLIVYWALDVARHLLQRH